MSGDSEHGHRRLIVEMGHGTADARTLRAVADLAALLHWDLHGLFIEDEALRSLAELPFARELRLPGHEWQKIDPDRIAAELRGAAAHAQRLLRQVGAAVGVPHAFEVRRGDPAKTLAAVAPATDVLVVATPTTAAARLAHGMTRVHSAAHESTASLLLLPKGFAPHIGPVAALLASADDPALAVAARAAMNIREHLLLLLPDGDAVPGEAALQRAVSLGVPKARVAKRALSSLRPEDVLHALGHVGERLLVLTRDASPAGDLVAASRVASDRAVAVLLLVPN